MRNKVKIKRFIHDQYYKSRKKKYPDRYPNPRSSKRGFVTIAIEVFNANRYNYFVLYSFLRKNYDRLNAYKYIRNSSFLYREEYIINKTTGKVVWENKIHGDPI